MRVNGNEECPFYFPPFGIVDSRIVHTGIAARGSCGLFQRRSSFGEAQEDEAEDSGRVLRRSQAAIGPKLVRGSPQAICQCIGGDVFFRGGDPLHTVTSVIGSRRGK